MAASVLRDNYAPADMARMLLRHYGELNWFSLEGLKNSLVSEIFKGITWESCGNENMGNIYNIHIYVLITYIYIYTHLICIYTYIYIYTWEVHGNHGEIHELGISQPLADDCGELVRLWVQFDFRCFRG